MHMFPYWCVIRRNALTTVFTLHVIVLHAVVGIHLFILKASAGEYDDYYRARLRDLKEYHCEQQRLLQRHNDEYKLHTAMTKKEYAVWNKNRQQALKAFRAAVTKRWNTFPSLAPTRWIEFSHDTQAVAIVDLEHGDVTVSILTNNAETEAALYHRMIREITRVFTSTGENQNGIPLARESDNRTQTYPLFISLAGIPIESTNMAKAAENVAKRIVDTAEIHCDTMKHAIDGDVMQNTLTFMLAPDYLKKLINPYIAAIIKYSAMYDLEPSLILATIHTESCFNPHAVSSAGAIGLMQLIPHQGGTEAYEFVYGQRLIPVREYLLDPEANIELGCAYLYLLKNRHFSGIHDQKSNRYCSIAGYNTGPANVAYAFTGNRDIPYAITTINAFDEPQKVYEFLLMNLPYVQTRNYLRDVVRRMETYGDLQR